MPTTIEWTHPPGYQGESWNPVTGCTKVSPGCTHCYAETISKRFGRAESFLPGGVAIMERSERLLQPLSWRQPRCVFTCSASDLFHPDVSVEWVAQVYATMWLTPQHIYQVLTKRPERMASLLNSHAFWSLVKSYGMRLWKLPQYKGGCYDVIPQPLPNVWAGTSIENETWLQRRAKELRRVPAVVRFFSVEPLLRDLPSLALNLVCSYCRGVEPPWRLKVKGCPVCGGLGARIHWVILGGESGRGARPMHPQWARNVKQACLDIGVPFFHKQWGSWRPVPHGQPWDERQILVTDTGRQLSDERVSRVKMGRLGLARMMPNRKKSEHADIDGVVWREWPHVIKESRRVKTKV